MNRLSKIWKNFRTFLSDEDGTAGLEFVASSPLLLGVLVFTAEYGQAMRARLVLDRAVQDAARYLALAPADKGAVDASGNPTIAFYNDILNTAENLIEQRVNGGVAFTVTTETVDSVNFREPYYVIRVQASSAIDMPLLSLINLFSPPPDEPGEMGAVVCTSCSPSTVRSPLTMPSARVLSSRCRAAGSNRSAYRSALSASLTQAAESACSPARTRVTVL